MSQRIVVIGAMGMLGRELFSRLKHSFGAQVIGTYHQAIPAAPSELFLPFDVTGPDESLTDLVSKGGLIVNCAVTLSSAMKQGDHNAVMQSMQVNSIFPKRLSREAEKWGARIIHISSDAVFSGRSAQPLSEDTLPDPADFYGASKLLGEDNGPNTVNIRTSIVGIDRTYHRGLLEWFLSHDPGVSIQGFVNHIWQGVTTRQLAELITTLVQRRAFDDIRRESYVHHFCPNEAVSKFELLTLFNRVFRRGVIVEPVTAPHGCVDRRLRTKFSTLQACYQGPVGIEKALMDLRESSL